MLTPVLSLDSASLGDSFVGCALTDFPPFFNPTNNSLIRFSRYYHPIIFNTAFGISHPSIHFIQQQLIPLYSFESTLMILTPPPSSPGNVSSTSGGTIMECRHCGSVKSPLWRRGDKREILCNACGLYWRNHGSKRPIFLKKPPRPSILGSKVYPTDGQEREPKPSQLQIEMKLDNAKEATTIVVSKLKRRIAAVEDSDAENDRPEASHSSKKAKKVEKDKIVAEMIDNDPFTLYTNYHHIRLPERYKKMKSACDPISMIDLSLSTHGPGFESSAIFSNKALDEEYGVFGRFLNFQEAILSSFKCYPSPMIYMSHTYHIKDIALIKGRSKVDYYFGSILGFYLNEYGQKFFTFAWCLPKRTSLYKLCHGEKYNGWKNLVSDKDFDILGKHEAVESMDCIITVLYSATQDLEYLPVDTK